jgi:ankyrin repeat protein
VNSRSEAFNKTPLVFAAHPAEPELLRVLLEHGAEVDSVDKSGRTPLSYAAEVGEREAMRVLLEYGAEVDSKNHVGATPLTLSIPPQLIPLVVLPARMPYSYY